MKARIKKFLQWCKPEPTNPWDTVSMVVGKTLSAGVAGCLLLTLCIIVLLFLFTFPIALLVVLIGGPVVWVVGTFIRKAIDE